MISSIRYHDEVNSKLRIRRIMRIFTREAKSNFLYLSKLCFRGLSDLLNTCYWLERWNVDTKTFKSLLEALWALLSWKSTNFKDSNYFFWLYSRLTQHNNRRRGNKANINERDLVHTRSYLQPKSRNLLHLCNRLHVFSNQYSFGGLQVLRSLTHSPLAILFVYALLLFRFDNSIFVFISKLSC